MFPSPRSILAHPAPQEDVAGVKVTSQSAQSSGAITECQQFSDTRGDCFRYHEPGTPASTSAAWFESAISMFKISD
jgi:hypothetical protein